MVVLWGARAPRMKKKWQRGGSLWCLGVW